MKGRMTTDILERREWVQAPEEAILCFITDGGKISLHCREDEIVYVKYKFLLMDYRQLFYSY